MPEFKVCAARVAAATSDGSGMSGTRRLVVVGNGMAGARLVEEVIARGGRGRFAVTVFGDEPHGNYNRILLSGVLAGSHQPEDIFINPLPWYAQHGVVLHAGDRVERDRRRAEAGLQRLGRRGALRHARHRHRQQRHGAADGRPARPRPARSRRASSSSGRSMIVTAFSNARETSRTRRRHRRRAARPRSRKGTAESRPRGPRPPPDGPRDGRRSSMPPPAASSDASSSRWACTSI